MRRFPVDRGIDRRNPRRGAGEADDASDGHLGDELPPGGARGHRGLPTGRDEDLPTVSTLGNHFSGPVIFAPMFTNHSQFSKIHEDSRIALNELPQANHTFYAWTRRAINQLAHEGITLSLDKYRITK